MQSCLMATCKRGACKLLRAHQDCRGVSQFPSLPSALVYLLPGCRSFHWTEICQNPSGEKNSSECTTLRSHCQKYYHCLCRQPQPGSGFSNGVPGPIAQPPQQAPPGLQGPHPQAPFGHFTGIAPGLPQPGPSMNVDFSGQGNHAGQQMLQQGPPPGTSRHCCFSQ